MSSRYLDPKVELPFKSQVGKNNAPLDNAADSLMDVGVCTPMKLERYHMSQDMAHIEPTMLADVKAEGLAEGDRLASQRIAKSVMALITDDAAIAAITGLTITEVTALRKSKQ